MASKKPVSFKPSVTAEKEFARALRKIGKHSGHIVEAHVDGHKIKAPDEMKAALEAYSKLIDPWAKRQAAKMLEKVSTKNKASWTKNSREMGRLLRSGLAEGAVAERQAALLNEQVALIKSLPIRAAERAQRLATEAFFNGTRASEVAEELMRSGKVSENDAIRIARTEVARSNAAMIQARAEAVGSRQYIWRNSGDAAVRESHRRYHGRNLDGMVFSWDRPPTLDDGTTGHPGTFPNCRCYAEPYFPKK